MQMAQSSTNQTTPGRGRRKGCSLFRHKRPCDQPENRKDSGESVWNQRMISKDWQTP